MQKQRFCKNSPTPPSSNTSMLVAKPEMFQDGQWSFATCNQLYKACAVLCAVHFHFSANVLRIPSLKIVRW